MLANYSDSWSHVIVSVATLISALATLVQSFRNHAALREHDKHAREKFGRKE